MGRQANYRAQTVANWLLLLPSISFFVVTTVVPLPFSLILAQASILPILVDLLILCVGKHERSLVDHLQKVGKGNLLTNSSSRYFIFIISNHPSCTRSYLSILIKIFFLLSCYISLHKGVSNYIISLNAL